MKTLPPSLLFFFVYLSAYAQNWSYDTLSEKKVEMGIGVIGDKIFFFSGIKKEGGSPVFVDKLDIFHTKTQTRQTLTLPAGSPGRIDAATAVYGSKLFVAGGNPGSSSKWVDIYDTTTGTWANTLLTLDRYKLASATANGKLLVAGGWSSSQGGYTNTVDIYNISAGTWTSTFLPTGGAKCNLTATALGNKVFFAGGDIGSNYFKSGVNIYNAQTNQWSFTNLSHPKTEHVTVVYKNSIYFAGGKSDNKSNNTRYPSDTIDVYNNSTDEWSTLKIPRLMYKQNGNIRYYQRGAQAGCKLFLIPDPDPRNSLASPPGNADTIAIYDLERNSWSFLPLPHPRTQVSVAASGNKVYFAGGTNVFTNDRMNDIDILTLEPRLKITANAVVASEYNMGIVALGESKLLTPVLENDGDYKLLLASPLTRISITGDVADFDVDQSLLDAADSLTPAQILSLPVTFQPTSTGVKQIHISVSSNDPANPVYSFTVKGTATEPTSTAKSNALADVKIYPNPTTGILYLKSASMQKLYTATLLNAQGTIVKETENISGSELDITEVPAGIYFLKLSDTQHSTVVKLVKK